jgi:hypothetical protein
LAWRFRKSARLPLGFRLNASKSGLGFSWGFRGFRIGRDAKGRTVRTLSIPGTGVFNRQVISTARSRATFVTVNSRGVGYQRRTENLEPALNLKTIRSSNWTRYSMFLFPSWPPRTRVNSLPG